MLYFNWDKKTFYIFYIYFICFVHYNINKLHDNRVFFLNYTGNEFFFFFLLNIILFLHVIKF